MSNLFRLEKLSESFDKLRTNGRGFDIVNDFPFMLRLSKHSEPFNSLFDNRSIAYRLHYRKTVDLALRIEKDCMVDKLKPATYKKQ
jgi:hypothetical protein